MVPAQSACEACEAGKFSNETGATARSVLAVFDQHLTSF
jgi:hypothetical protein